MRVLIAHPGPSASVADVYDGYAKAFRTLGCEVGEFNLADRLAFYCNAQMEGAYLEPGHAVKLAVGGLEKACYRFWPDVLVIVSGFFIDGDLWDLWKRRPQKTVVLLTESPYEDDKQLTVIDRAEADLVLVNDPVNLDRYKRTCARSFYMPHSYDPDRHHPRGERPHDFTFVGTGYPSRVDLFSQIDWTGLDVKFGGYWKDVEEPLASFVVNEHEILENEQTAELYAASKMSANLYRGRDPREANRYDLLEGWACGPREIELAASETFFAREPRGESDALFPMLPTFADAGELQDLIGWWLAHDTERETAAKLAAARIEDRTFVNHARRMLQLLQ